PTTISTAIDDTLLVLVPSSPLQTNATYTAEVDRVADRSGNLLQGTPIIHRFNTLDTVGPTITDLEPVGATIYATGTRVTFVATLAAPETNPQLQATIDLSTFAISTPGDLHVTVTMPTSPGAAIVHARAIDRFGNFGPFFDKPISVIQNAPPSVTIVKAT